MIILNYILCSFSIFTLIFDFERQVFTPDSVHNTQGTLYFKQDERSLINICVPIKQIMIFNENEWTVYYPKQKQAYVFERGYFRVPFVDILLASFKEDFGLINAGFQLLHSTVKQDTLYSVWQTHKMGSPIRVQLEQWDQVYTKFKLIKNDTVRINTTFDRFYQLNGKYMPQSIVSKILTIRNDEFLYNTEVLTISNMLVNESIPDSILNFDLPNNCQIKYINQN